MIQHLSKKTLVHVSLASVLLLTLAACTKCGTGATNSEDTKESYIASQDAICAQTTPTSTEIGKHAASFRPDMTTEEKLQFAITLNGLNASYYQELSDALAKAPQPKEDAATLQELLAGQKTIIEISKNAVEQSKKMLELVGKLNKTEQGQEPDPELMAQIKAAKEEGLKLRDDMKALTGKLAELAKKYGFKSCFLPKA